MAARNLCQWTHQWQANLADASLTLCKRGLHTQACSCLFLQMLQLVKRKRRKAVGRHSSSGSPPLTFPVTPLSSAWSLLPVPSDKRADELQANRGKRYEASGSRQLQAGKGDHSLSVRVLAGQWSVSSELIPATGHCRASQQSSAP